MKKPEIPANERFTLGGGTPKPEGPPNVKFRTTDSVRLVELAFVAAICLGAAGSALVMIYLRYWN